LHADYFQDLNIPQQYYDISTQKFNKNAIQYAIEEIIEIHKQEYKYLAFNVKKLNFDDLHLFAISLLTEAKFMNYKQL
jgi:hypothetical protein